MSNGSELAPGINACITEGSGVHAGGKLQQPQHAARSVSYNHLSGNLRQRADGAPCIADHGPDLVHWERVGPFHGLAAAVQHVCHV
jgi:hypothetical protein